MTEPEDTKGPNPGGLGAYSTAVPGYLATKHGIFKKTSSEPQLISHNRIIVSQRFVDDEGKEAWELKWFNDGRWHSGVFEVSALMQSRELVDQLGGLGVSVQKPAALGHYLDDLRHRNDAVIPVHRITRHLGWQGDLETFLHTEQPHLMFRPKSRALTDRLNHYRAAGSFEEWQAAFAMLEDHPTAALFVFAALAAPLLRILNQRSFAVDMSGETTSGKTTALEVGNSVWSEPKEIIVSWNNTQIFIEQLLSTTRGLPLAMDETQTVRNPGVVGDVLYMLHEEVGRGRGEKAGGIQALHVWSVVLCSTGEQSLTTFTQDAGVRGRVITTRQRPFPPGEAKLVLDVTARIRANYGHAGPAFIKGVLDARRHWSVLEAKWQAMAAELLACATDDISGRRAPYVAALRIAAETAHKWGIVGWKPAAEFWGSLLVPASGEEDDDRPLAALTAAYEWYVANPDRFMAHPKGGGLQPPQGWAGLLDSQHLAFFPEHLKKMLGDKEFSYHAVIGSWKERGWVDAAAGRNQYKKRVPSEYKSPEAHPTLWMVAIKRTALAHLGLEAHPNVIDIESRRSI